MCVLLVFVSVIVVFGMSMVICLVGIGVLLIVSLLLIM